MDMCHLSKKQLENIRGRSMQDISPGDLSGEWNDLIGEITAGDWTNPETGEAVVVPFKHVKIGDDFANCADEMLDQVMPAESYAVVCDATTADVMGTAVARKLGAKADLVVLNHPHADMGHVRNLARRTKNSAALVAVGSGTLNDLCKYTSFLDGRPYSVFATAPSMNGYTSPTASITLDSGMKTTQEAHAAKGVFIDIKVSAMAPQYLISAGLGDCLCRPTAQVDWYFSHAMLETCYATVPYMMQQADEIAALTRTKAMGRRDPAAIGSLQRWLTLSGLGIAAVGMSHPGSMGEHQISHWLDCFIGARHPGTVHGQQVGVASVTMARLQSRILAREEPPVVAPWQPDEAQIRARYPKAVVADCLAVCRAKSMDEAATAAFNARLHDFWPQLRAKLCPMLLEADEMATYIRNAGGGATATEIGLDRDSYVAALRYCREIRNRYSFLDLAADAGLLEDFIEECV